MPSWNPAFPEKSLWMQEYWDRYIRDETHLKNVIAYIHENPVKAGLAPAAALWPWSSARHLGTPGYSSAPPTYHPFHPAAP